MITKRIYDGGQLGSHTALFLALFPSHCPRPMTASFTGFLIGLDQSQHWPIARQDQAVTAVLMGTWPCPRWVWKVTAVGSCENPWSWPVFPQREIRHPEEMPSPVPGAKLEENQVVRLSPLPG